MTTLLPLTEHNLDYFLEAYDREWQPTEMKVPYDRWGNEITIPAPRRDDVQRAVLEFDSREMGSYPAALLRSLMSHFWE